VTSRSDMELGKLTDSDTCHRQCLGRVYEKVTFLVNIPCMRDGRVRQRVIDISQKV